MPTVIVENAGAFVLNFRVSATVGGQPFHYNSGNYSTGDSKSGQVPDGATDITMVIKDERFIDDWHTIHAQNWPDASEWVDGAVAFVVSGMASTEQWKQVQ